MKLYSHHADSLIHQFSLPDPGWTCVFDPLNPHVLYAGTNANTIVAFDTRNPNEPFQTHCIPFRRGKGIHSLCSTDSQVYGGCFDGVFSISGDAKLFSIPSQPNILACIDVFQDKILTVWKSQYQVSALPSDSEFILNTPIEFEWGCKNLFAKSRIYKDQAYIAGFGSNNKYKCYEYQRVQSGSFCRLVGVQEKNNILIWD
jgi:hypothetical protein